MLAQEGKLSLYCFLSALTSVSVFLLPYFGCLELYLNLEWRYLLVYFSVLAFLMRIFLTDYFYEIGIRGFLLGAVFSSGIYVSFTGDPSYRMFGWYMCIISFFHWSEYVTIAITNPASLTIDAYILNHSPQYKIAAVSSWAEFWIEYWLWPEVKTYTGVSLFGLALCLGGESVRKLAMFTAMNNFNHVVQSRKQEGHTLVTHGVYSVCRHPSYAGWFYWAVGTQMILCNPLCTVVYFLVSWKFFQERIAIEEVTLLTFFQSDYVRYQKRVPTGLPFIRGYLLGEV